MSHRTPLYMDFSEGSILQQSEDDIRDGFLPQQSEETFGTSDATPTTLAFIDLPADARGIVLITLAGNKSDGSGGIVGGKAIHWKSAASVASVVASITTVTDNLETLTTATWSVDASGSQLRIRVTGESSTSIYWSAVWTIKYVNTQGV